MILKRFPEDFRVEELPSAALLADLRPGPGPFAVFRLEKRGLSTPEAVAALARRVGLPAGRIAHAGLKDKHGVSVQSVSAELRDAPESVAGKDWSARRLGWAARPVATTDSDGNRFQVVVRGLSPEAAGAMDRAAARLATAEGLRFPNLFGVQRFGSARHGRGFAARSLVAGDFEEALRLSIAVHDRQEPGRVKEIRRAVSRGWGRWEDLSRLLPPCPERRIVEHLARRPGDFRGAWRLLPYFQRQMQVYAWQSHLWNATALRLLDAGLADPGLDLPLFGRKSGLREPWAAAARAVLEAEGVATADLRIPGERRPFFAEEPRPLFALAAEVRMDPPEPDPTGGLLRRLAFRLPRGAYATVLLRFLAS